MKKMKTVFVIDRSIHRSVNQVNPENEWVTLGEGIATIKYDGTSCAIIDGDFYKRYDVKKGRTVPNGAIACEPHADPKTGHWPHWVKVGEGPEDKHHRAGFDALQNKVDGTYELCGSKIQSGKSGITETTLVRHGDAVIPEAEFERTFEGLKKFLETFDHEGIVFHHPDGRMAKVRKADFGIKW